jgi:SAM-dependent methyltransferase
LRGPPQTGAPARSAWPKRFPALTAEQEAIRADFLGIWLETIARWGGLIERFNHRYPVRHAPPRFRTTLEVGAGVGSHLAYERLTPEQEQGYVALERDPVLAARIRARFPGIRVLVGDCQVRQAFPDGAFDRILAIHVLEHLPDLPAAIREAHRLCAPGGIFSVVIPCEGGWLYGRLRRISAQRLFERRYRQPYGWFIEREHVNRPAEILEELAAGFTVEHRSHFPMGVPGVAWNLCIGLTLRPRTRTG